MTDLDVKWMVVRVEHCSICRRGVKHNIGVYFPAGEETQVKECLKCHEITALPR